MVAIDCDMFDGLCQMVWDTSSCAHLKLDGTTYIGIHDVYVLSSDFESENTPQTNSYTESYYLYIIQPQKWHQRPGIRMVKSSENESTL